MWIFCCGMKRSGSTLQFQLTARIVEETGLGKRVEWVKPEDFPILREKYQDYDGLKVFKCHIFTPEIGEEFEKHNAVGVYVYRDIRDAFLSQMSKHSASFYKQWEHVFLENSMLNFYKWTSLPRMLISKYEDMIVDLPWEVERIASHLGISFDQEKCERIAADYSLERQKERISNTPKEVLQQHNNSLFNSQELLHMDHIHTGEVGRWQNAMSPLQIALIEKKARKWLVENGYKLSEPQLNFVERILVRVIN